MSKYTTEVRYICEMDYLMKYGEVDGVKPNVIIEKTRESIFDFDFPIFDESYRSVLETKIIKHYYTREIGEEVVGLWKLRLDEKMNLIMPYYNQMYESARLEFDPLVNHKIVTEHKGKNDGTTNGTSNDTIGEHFTSKDERTENGSRSNDNTNNVTTDNSGTGYNLFSDTPQGGLNGLDGIEEPDGSGTDKGYYLTNATKTTDTTLGHSTTTGHVSETTAIGSTNENESDRSVTNNNSNTNEIHNTDEYLRTVSGLIGTNASRLLLDYRKTLINIDEMIIKDLDVLFMQLW